MTMQERMKYTEDTAEAIAQLLEKLQRDCGVRVDLISLDNRRVHIECTVMEKAKRPA